VFIGFELSAQEFNILITEKDTDTEGATGTALTEIAMTHAGPHRSARHPIAHRTTRASAFMDLCHLRLSRLTGAQCGDAQLVLVGRNVGLQSVIVRVRYSLLKAAKELARKPE
jgi:hypothetical protein